MGPDVSSSLSGRGSSRMGMEADHAELMGSLGRLVRGLSALFWGLPFALVVCVQTTRADWLQVTAMVPPLLATGLLLYGLSRLAHFRKHERVWHRALDRARIFAVLNMGLTPFLYWWNRLPTHPLYEAMVNGLILSAVVFLLLLNPVLRRLAAMLPDETLRQETRVFTTLNQYLLSLTALVLLGYFALKYVHPPPLLLLLQKIHLLADRTGLIAVLFFLLMPVAMTMALIWKIKEVILASVFSHP